MDIGSGKGLVLLQQPFGPHLNYIGIERRLKYIKLASDRIERRGLNNVRLLHGDAEQLLSPLFAAQSVASFSLLFPDPWHKRRHQKRRLVTARFVELLATKLKPNGVVMVATDHADYFAVITNCFNNQEAFVFAPQQKPPLQLSHFEIKYSKQKRPIYRTAYRRVH